jgi:murein DD-endopeptidase MepM/ murein hydrolase activator NlpD
VLNYGQVNDAPLAMRDDRGNMSLSNRPARRYRVPIVSCTIGDDTFTPKNGLMEARIFVAEGERQSNCSFLVYDPDQEWAQKYFKASYDQGGIEGLPPATPATPGATDVGAASVSIAGLSPIQQTNAALIAKVAREKGCNDVQISAIISGAMQESLLGTANDEVGGYGGKGLFQLTDAEGQTGTWIGKGGITSIKDYYDPSKNTRAILEDYAFAGWLQSSANQTPEQAATSFADQVLRPFQVGDKYAGKSRQLFPGGQVAGKFTFGPTAQPQPQVGGTPSAPATTDKPIDLSTIPNSAVKSAELKETSNKGQTIKITIGTDPTNTFEWEFVHIGTSHEMHLNSTEFSGGTVRWIMNRRLKNTAYQEITIKQLAQMLASNYGLTLECPEDGPKFKYLDQTGITDYELLRRECDRIGWRIYEKGDRLVVEPRKNGETVLVLRYGEDIAKFRCEDRAQTDSAELGRDFSQPSARSTQGDAKLAIDSQKGDMVATTPESQAAKGGGSMAATTGSPIAPITPTVEIGKAAGENAVSTGSPIDLSKVPNSAVKQTTDQAASAKRVKGFKSTIECPTSEALLGLTIDDPIKTENFKADFFNRMWVVGSLEHRWNGALNSTIQIYTPMTPKPGVSLGDTPATATPTAVATGKILNPHSDGGTRGGFFDPSGNTIRIGRGHKGIDTIGDYNLRAGFDGVVEHGFDEPGWGNYLIIKGEGAWAGYELLYGHLASYSAAAGSKVKTGQTIGIMGTTGGSTGDHLHLELWKGGTKLDPEPYISPCFNGIHGSEGQLKPLSCKG